MRAGADDGAVRRDVPAPELVGFALGALDAARQLPSAAAVDRLFALVETALTPPGHGADL